MSVRAWILFPTGLGLLIALVYALAGQYTIGVGLAAATLTALAWQLRPLDHQGVVAGWVRSSAWIVGIKLCGLFAAATTILVLMVQAAVDHWARYRVGTVAIFAMSGLELMLLVELNRQEARWFEKWKGVHGEELVRAELDPLQKDGWVVFHNYKPLGRRGNVDHIVIHPKGAFAIETKAGHWYWGAGVSQAIGSAMAVRELLHCSWVTGVLCVPDQDPVLRGKAWIVGRNQLATWLRTAGSREGRPIDFPEAAARIEALAL